MSEAINAVFRQCILLKNSLKNSLENKFWGFWEQIRKSGV